MADLSLRPRTAFDGLLEPAGEAGRTGVSVCERASLSLATVLARKGQARALADAVRGHCGLDLPAAGLWSEGGGTMFLSTGPGAWLVMREEGGYGLAKELAEALGGIASVSDQTDGYGVLRLSGPRVRDVLAKGVHLDLDPGRFPVGAVAATTASHVGVTLWRLPDLPDGAPVFEAALFRSYAGSFWHWLSASAAEHGLTVGDRGAA